MSSMGGARKSSRTTVLPLNNPQPQHVSEEAKIRCIPTQFESKKCWELKPIGSAFAIANGKTLEDVQAFHQETVKLAPSVTFKQLFPIENHEDDQVLVTALQTLVPELFGLKVPDPALSLDALLAKAVERTNYEVVKFVSINNEANLRLQCLSAKLFGCNAETLVAHGGPRKSIDNIMSRVVNIGCLRGLHGTGAYSAVTNKDQSHPNQFFALFHALHHATMDPATGEQCVALMSATVPEVVAVGTRNEFDKGTVDVAGVGEGQRSITTNPQASMIIASHDVSMMPVAIITVRFRKESQMTIDQYKNVRVFEKTLWAQMRDDPDSVVSRSIKGPEALVTSRIPVPVPNSRIPVQGASNHLSVLLTVQNAQALSNALNTNTTQTIETARIALLRALKIGASMVPMAGGSSWAAAAGAAGRKLDNGGVYVPPTRTSCSHGNTMKRSWGDMTLKVGDWVCVFQPYKANHFVKGCFGVIDRIIAPEKQKLDYEVKFVGDAAFTALAIKEIKKRKWTVDASRNNAHVICTVGELEPCPVSTVVYTVNTEGDVVPLVASVAAPTHVDDTKRPDKKSREGKTPADSVAGLPQP